MCYVNSVKAAQKHRSGIRFNFNGHDSVQKSTLLSPSYHGY